jgi:hypothetical protein
MNVEYEKHRNSYQKQKNSYQIPMDVVQKVLGHVFIAKWVVEATIVLLAQASEITPPAVKIY